jgi:hypothetical protein
VRDPRLQRGTRSSPGAGLRSRRRRTVSSPRS